MVAIRSKFSPFLFFTVLAAAMHLAQAVFAADKDLMMMPNSNA